VAAPQRTFIRVVRHVQPLARVLLRASHVYQLALRADVRQDLVPECPVRGILAFACLVGRGRVLRHLAGHRAALFLPLQASTVHDLGRRVAEELKDQNA